MSLSGAPELLVKLSEGLVCVSANHPKISLIYNGADMIAGVGSDYYGEGTNQYLSDSSMRWILSLFTGPHLPDFPQTYALIIIPVVLYS